ncbi:MAG TPA: hypothetical protein VN681_12850 [Stellaceae bacterium]|nr:hypothetical protein [Stellaceae bacterium]
MQRIVAIAARTDAFCARLNHGLTAVALALAALTVVLFVAQHPDIFQPINPEWPGAEQSY